MRFICCDLATYNFPAHLIHLQMLFIHILKISLCVRVLICVDIALYWCIQNFLLNCVQFCWFNIAIFHRHHLQSRMQKASGVASKCISQGEHTLIRFTVGWQRCNIWIESIVYIMIYRILLLAILLSFCGPFLWINPPNFYTIWIEKRHKNK